METITSNWNFAVILWVPLTDWSCTWITPLIMYSPTSTNSHLFTMATFLGRQSIHRHLFKLLYNGHSPPSPRWPLWRVSTVIKLLWAELFEGWLALNPRLKLTQVSFSSVQKHYLRYFSVLFLELPIINL